MPANHPPISDQAPSSPSAPGGLTSNDALIEQLDRTEGVRGRDKPFEVALSLSRLYYGNGRFPDAVVFLGEALQKAEPLRNLYLQARAKAPGALPQAAAECAAEEPLEKKLERSRERVKARDNAGAAACALAALQPAIEAERLLGHARFLTGDAEGALTALERVLQVAPDDSEALYAHATVLFEARPDDVKALAKAKAEWEQFLKAEPSSPRVAWTRRMVSRAEQAIAVGGVSALDKKLVAEAPSTVAGAPPMQPGNASPPPLTQETMKALQDTQVTPEMIARFATLIEEGEVYLAGGRFQQALDNYKQVMPFQPENARLRAGMAWALVGLKRQPMADRIWEVAVTSNPEAVDALGQALKARGDAAGARSVWTKLAETAPSYAQKTGLKARLEK